MSEMTSQRRVSNSACTIAAPGPLGAGSELLQRSCCPDFVCLPAHHRGAAVFFNVDLPDFASAPSRRSWLLWIWPISCSVLRQSVYVYVCQRTIAAPGPSCDGSALLQRSCCPDFVCLPAHHRGAAVFFNVDLPDFASAPSRRSWLLWIWPISCSALRQRVYVYP